MKDEDANWLALVLSLSAVGIVIVLLGIALRLARIADALEALGP